MRLPKEPASRWSGSEGSTSRLAMSPVRVRAQLTPPLRLRYTPRLDAVHRVSGRSGWTSMRVWVRPMYGAQSNAVALQLSPPSSEVQTPMDRVSPKSPSPVAIHSRFGSVGWKARSVTPIEVSWPLPIAAQLSPPSWVRHNPPAGAQAHHSSKTPGRGTTRFRRPLPPRPVGPMGPSYCHSGSFRVRAADSDRASSRASSSARRVRPLVGRRPSPSTRGAMKDSQRWKGFIPLPRSTLPCSAQASKAWRTESIGTSGLRMRPLQCTASCPAIPAEQESRIRTARVLIGVGSNAPGAARGMFQSSWSPGRGGQFEQGRP